LSLFSSVQRIGDPYYIPSDRDILLYHVGTTGITETTFPLPAAVGKHDMYDVGGTRSGRKKWIHAFDTADAVIFTVDIGSYNQLLVEDETVNRMQKALTLFDSIANSRWFTTTLMALFFAKCDKLRPKLHCSPPKNYFPDFDGAQDDVEAAKSLHHEQVRFTSMMENEKSL